MAIAAVSSASPTGALSGSNVPAGSIQQAASILKDETGKFSDDDKLAAFKTIQANWTSLSKADAAAVDDAYNSSSFVKHIQDAQNAFIKALSANGNQNAKSSDALRADAAAYDALSDADKKLVVPAFNGQTGDEWKATTLARASLARFVEDAVAAGKTSLGSTSCADPKVNAALELGGEIDGKVVGATNLNSWTQRVQQLLGQFQPQPSVKIDISDAAKAYISAQTRQSNQA